MKRITLCLIAMAFMLIAALPAHANNYDWQDALTIELGGTPNPQSHAMLTAWASHAENTRALHNPLATTKKEPGSWPLPGNPSGVQQYPDQATGVRAMAWTLNNYPSFADALKRGDIEALLGQPDWKFNRYCGPGCNVPAYKNRLRQGYNQALAARPTTVTQPAPVQIGEGIQVERQPVTANETATSFKTAGITVGLAFGAVALFAKSAMSLFMKLWHSAGVGSLLAFADRLAGSWSTGGVISGGVGAARAALVDSGRIIVGVSLLAVAVALLMSHRGQGHILRTWASKATTGALTGIQRLSWLTPYLGIAATICLILTRDVTRDGWYLVPAVGAYLGMTLGWSLFGKPRFATGSHLVKAPKIVKVRSKVVA